MPAPRLRLLQSPALIDGAAVHTLQPLSAALLALLALRGPMARDALAALLYPGGGRDRQLTNLRQRLHQLRELSAGLLRVGRQEVALAAGVVHDLADPEDALAQDPEALPGALLGSLDFGDAHELADWLRREREAWVGRRRELLTRHCLDHEENGRIAAALRYASRLVADEPTHEHAVRLLMRLHYRRGDRGAALAAYERCVQALNDQFGDAVSEETARLGAEIAEGAQAVPLPVQPMPLALRHPPAMVGRDALLRAALARWDEARVVLVGGPAGIGKSRLFDALCRRTGTTQLLTLAADDAEVPLGLLRRLVALLSGRPAPAGTAPLLQAALRDLLARGSSDRPLQLGIEDLHFADPDSLAALVPLLPPAGPPHVRWWLSSRHPPWPAPLADWLGREHGPDPVVELPEWTEDQVAAFVASVGGDGVDAAAWAQALHRHCGGHPLYLLWVLRSVHEQGAWGRRLPPAPLPQPLEMQARIARRLDGSDALTQQLAFVGAIAGQDFEAALVARVTGRRAAELAAPWRRLEALGVLRGAGFSHELMRQAVLQAIPQALRPLLHADVAQALPHADGVHERRGAHWQAAGRPLDAAEDYQRAAEEALRLGLPTRALGLYARAEALQAGQGRLDAAFELRWQAGRLAILWDSADRAMADAEHLLAHARSDRQRAQALLLRAQAKVERHDADALDDADAALALARACADPALERGAMLRRAGALHVLGRWAEALALLDAVRSGQAGAPTAQDEGEIEDLRCPVLASLGRRREAVEGALAARDRALAAGHWQRAADMASNVGVQCCYLGELGRAIAACEESIALCERIGADRGSIHVDQMTLAGLYLDAGRFAEAVALGEAAAAGVRAAGLTGWIANADNSLASMFMLLGRFDLAARHLADLPPDAPTWTRAAREMLSGVLQYRRTGRSPMAHLRRAQALFAEGGAYVIPFIRHRIAAEVAAWSPLDEALPMLADGEAWAESQQQVSLRRVIRRMRVEVLLTAGRHADAAAAADALEADFAGQWEAVNFYLPDMWRTLARAWEASGQAARAQALVGHGRAWLDERLRHHVPPAFADTFRTENRTNRWFLERRWPA